MPNWRSQCQRASGYLFRTPTYSHILSSEHPSMAAERCSKSYTTLSLPGLTWTCELPRGCSTQRQTHKRKPTSTILAWRSTTRPTRLCPTFWSNVSAPRNPPWGRTSSLVVSVAPSERNIAQCHRPLGTGLIVNSGFRFFFEDGFAGTWQTRGMAACSSRCRCCQSLLPDAYERKRMGAEREASLALM